MAIGLLNARKRYQNGTTETYVCKDTNDANAAVSNGMFATAYHMAVTKS